MHKLESIFNFAKDRLSPAVTKNYLKLFAHIMYTATNTLYRRKQSPWRHDRMRTLIFLFLLSCILEAQETISSFLLYEDRRYVKVENGHQVTLFQCSNISFHSIGLSEKLTIVLTLKMKYKQIVFQISPCILIFPKFSFCTPSLI